MALQTKRGSVLPPGAVPVSREDAIQYQKKLIRNWPSEIDVLFLKYGSHMTTAATMISSCVVVNQLKQFFKLQTTTSTLLSFVTCGVLPSIVSYMSTEKFVTDNVLLMKMDCPICGQLKFAVIQLYISVFYPASVGYLSLVPEVHVQNTYPLPNLKTHAREFWRETFNILKKSAPAFRAPALGQSLWILFLPYMQNIQLYTVMSKARENIISEESNEPESNVA